MSLIRITEDDGTVSIVATPYDAAKVEILPSPSEIPVHEEKLSQWNRDTFRGRVETVRYIQN